MSETLMIFIPNVGEVEIPVIDYFAGMSKPLDLLAALRNYEEKEEKLECQTKS